MSAPSGDPTGATGAPGATGPTDGPSGTDDTSHSRATGSGQATGSGRGRGPAGGRVRTSDAEREQVATILRAAASEGRLSIEECDERLRRAYEATYRDELAPLTADLPGDGWDALHHTPEALAGLRRRLRLHVAGVAVLVAVLVGLFLLSHAHFFWPVFPIAFLTFGLLRHRLFVRRMAGGWGGPPWARGPWGGGPWGRGPWGHGPWEHGPRARGWGRGPWDR